MMSVSIGTEHRRRFFKSNRLVIYCTQVCSDQIKKKYKYIGLKRIRINHF